MSARAYFAISFIAISCFGCDVQNAGDAPTSGVLYYPNSLAISGEAEPRFLFVASSNYDLRFNAGAVHAFSLQGIDKAIKGCETLGAEECTIETQAVLADEVVIPTYATSIALAPDGKRLFVASRTRRSLQIIDVEPDAEDVATEGGEAVASSLLSCGQGATRACGAFSAHGVDRTTDAPIEPPINPADLTTGRLSDLSGDPDDDERTFVAVAHQTGDVSLLTDDEDGQLTLSSILRDLPTPASIALDPLSQELHVARRGADLLRIGVAVAAAPPGESKGAERFSLFRAGSLGLEGASITDVRALAFLPPAIDADGSPASRALLLSGVPSALVVADVTPRADGRLNGRVEQLTEVGTGADRFAIGSIGGRSYAAISCLEGRALYLVDLAAMQTRAVVPNLSGPHGVAFDAARQRLYVTDFRSSVVRIVDLAPLADPTSEQPVQVIATLGRPHIVQELK
jgi:DNA-binding beta-propeller fold protein YncE